MPILSVRTNGNHLAARQRIRGKAVSTAMRAQARAYGESVKSNAVALSQGTISDTMLRAYSPGLYSRARAGNAFADAEINTHTGLFAKSWQVRVWSVGDNLTVTILNLAPYSAYMLGTVKMRKRDILGRATGQLKPFYMQMLQAKRKGEGSVSGSGLLMDLINVTVTVGIAYGSAGFE